MSSTTGRSIQTACPTERQRVKRLLFIPLCLALNGCVIGNLAMWAQVRQYSGDGVIYNCASSPPILGALICWPGYRIDFPSFPSDRPYMVSYRLSNVPQRDRQPAVIYLRFRTESNPIAARSMRNSVTSVFRIVLSEPRGKILHSAELPVASSGWTSDDKNEFGVYELEKSELYFERRHSYVLTVSYVPGEVPPPARELYFSIQNGGSK